MTKPLILLGGGGHAKVLTDILHRQGAEIIAVSVPSIIPKMKENLKLLHWINGLRIIKDKEVFNYNPAEIYLANGLGSTDVGSRRGQIFKEYAENGYSFINVIHSSAIVADEVVLGKGVQIMAGVIIQPGCKLGNNVLVNTGTVMDHDCNIGEHVHLATGVTVSGNVCIGENTHIGTGAKIINNITIGANCTVGAGAVIIDDIPQNMRVAGVPAKIIGRNQP